MHHRAVSRCTRARLHTCWRKCNDEQPDGFNLIILKLRTSVTSLLSYIDISTLEQCRQSSRLILFYKIISNLLPISIPGYYQHTQFHTRQHHTNHFILPQPTLNSYKYIFYPRTIKDWNNLPTNVIEARDLDEFTCLLNLNCY